VHVFIHDLDAMDEALLNQAPSISSSRIDPRIFGRLNRQTATSNVASRPLPRMDIAREAEQMARQAEERGKPGVARLHWQRAARHGSMIAARQLSENYASAKGR
jgi:hypothetical protein